MQRSGRTRLTGTWMVLACATALVAMPGAGLIFAQDNTPHVEVYGFVQADYIQDFKRVDPAWVDTLRPSKIATDGLGEDGQASLSAKQSRLGVLMNLPTSNHPVYTKFEFDMFGVGVDEGQTTIRLRHAYGEWNHWLAGQTNTLFMDASIFPNVIDYWGPAGMAFIRNPQIRYSFIQTEHRTFSIAIERPSSDVDGGQVRVIDPVGNLVGVTGIEKVPDFTAQYRDVEGWGHWQVAGVLRKVAFETPTNPDGEPNGSELGYGVDLTGSYKLGNAKKNSIMAGVVWGRGIASYMNDGGVDLSADGTLVDPEASTLPLLGVSAYYNHYWSDRYSSAFGYSFTKVDNRDLQTADAYHNGEYASANLLYYPTKNVMCGGEALWGKRTDNDDADGDDLRVQFSFHYSFSTKDIFKKNTRESGA